MLFRKAILDLENWLGSSQRTLKNNGAIAEAFTG